MTTLSLFPVLKATTLKFAYYLIGAMPILFLIFGQKHPGYSFFAAGSAFIASHFLRREIKKLQPVHEWNLTEFIALGLLVILWSILVFNRFFGLLV